MKGMMKREETGWIIITEYEPNGRICIWASSFEWRRTDAIQNFLRDSSKNWRWWKRNLNAKAVRATRTITLDQ
jgi:hypothetical protein